MDCRTRSAHKFRTRLGFKKYDVILIKEQSVPTKIMSSFRGQYMQTQYNVLNYRIDLYFHEYKFAIEIDGNEIQKAIEEGLGCKFTKIDHDEKDFDIFGSIKEIFRRIKKSTKKTLTNKVSARLEFKSGNIIKSKAIKFIVKQILPDYK